MDDTNVEKAVQGLDAKRKDKVLAIIQDAKDKVRKKSGELRQQARQRGIIVSAIVAGGSGMAAEAIRRKLVGRYAKKVQNQGIGLLIIGLATKAGAKYAGIPLLHDLGDGIIAQGGSVGTAEMIYGAKDPLVVALEGTVTAGDDTDDDDDDEE